MSTSNERDHFDLLIIGAGQASVPLATALHKAQWRVAVVEREHLGGSCVNFGCIPTKAVLESAKLAHQARRAAEYGLKIPDVEVDFAAVLNGAKALVESSRNSLREEFEGSDSPTLIRGNATIQGRQGDLFKVKVGDRAVLAKQLVLSTGTRSIIPEVEGIGEVDYIDAHSWLEHRTLPERLLVLGGGYIGLELGQFYNRMGAEVTVIDDGEQIAAREDRDVAEQLQALLEEDGLTFSLNTSTQKVEKTTDGVALTVEQGGETRRLEGSHLFIATGRQPNTDRLGLESIGVDTDDKGVVQVDDTLATNVEGVWVAGDIRGGPMFTHSAYDDYRILESQLLGDGSHTAERTVPYGMFTDPQLGRVGMSEKAAKEAGKDYLLGHYNMKVNGRARAARKKDGCIKVVIERGSDKLLGAAVLAAEGAEMVHAYIALMNAKAPYTSLLSGLHIHPTYSEGLHSALKEVG